MQKCTVIGTRPTKFTPKDASGEIQGTTVYITMPNDYVTGVAAERVFLKKAVTDICGIPVVGSEIILHYNRYGKPEHFEVLSTPKGS